MGIVGFVCVGLKQVFLGEGSLRAGFIFDLRVRPGARFTSTGMSLLNGKPLGTTDLGDFAKAAPHPQPRPPPPPRWQPEP